MNYSYCVRIVRQRIAWLNTLLPMTTNESVTQYEQLAADGSNFFTDERFYQYTVLCIYYNDLVLTSNISSCDLIAGISILVFRCALVLSSHNTFRLIQLLTLLQTSRFFVESKHKREQSQWHRSQVADRGKDIRKDRVREKIRSKFMVMTLARLAMHSLTHWATSECEFVRTEPFLEQLVH